MATKRRLIRRALCQLSTAAMASVVMPDGWTAPPRVYEETKAPQGDPIDGDVVIGKGRLASRPVEMGMGVAGVTYECTFTVPIEIVVPHEYVETEEEAIDAIEPAIGAAVLADPSLGGLIENLELTTADEAATGDDTIGLGEAAQLFVVCTWYATNPIA